MLDMLETFQRIDIILPWLHCVGEEGMQMGNGSGEMPFLCKKTQGEQ